MTLKSLCSFGCSSSLAITQSYTKFPLSFTKKSFIHYPCRDWKPKIQKINTCELMLYKYFWEGWRKQE